MNKFKRRDLLKSVLSASALGAANLSGSALAASASKRVLVVGAGLSGLYAAMLLEQFGYSVQVVEGRQRIGGRLYTLDDIPGHPEAGGNGMGPNYGRIIDSARRLNVPLRLQGRGLPSSYFVDDTRMTAEDWKTWASNPLPEELKALIPERISGKFLQPVPLVARSDWRNPAYSEFDISATEFFKSQGLDDRAIALIDVNNSYGNTLQETSLLSLYRVRASINQIVSMKQPGMEAAEGNMRLPEAMAASLMNPVAMGQRIVEVEQSSELVRAKSDTGEVYEADAMIMALPVPAVRDINFAPGFSSDQQAAFESIDYHKTTQAHILASEPFWESAGNTASYWTNGPLGRIFTRKVPDSNFYNMTVWINGDACDQFDDLQEDLAKQRIMEEFNKVHPGADQYAELRHLVRWKKEPLNQGAWAIWKPGQIGQYADLLHQPAGKIFFAGEHTAYSNSGMEGAAESGERTAIEVMELLS